MTRPPTNDNGGGEDLTLAQLLLHHAAARGFSVSVRRDEGETVRGVFEEMSDSWREVTT
jgi:hypothetical protein